MENSPVTSKLHTRCRAPRNDYHRHNPKAQYTNMPAECIHRWEGCVGTFMEQETKVKSLHMTPGHRHSVGCLPETSRAWAVGSDSGTLRNGPVTSCTSSTTKYYRFLFQIRFGFIKLWKKWSSYLDWILSIENITLCKDCSFQCQSLLGHKSERANDP